MSFFAELKRRNVFRVGIAYVVVGWLLAQVAEFAFENFGAPEWALRTFVIFLLLGLPLALLFAWAFEITPEGLRLEKNVDRSRSITARTGRKLDFIIIAVLAIAVTFLLVERFWISTSDGSSDEIVATETQSIAVLPFVNMSDDNDYFADGLSEELLNLLARIPDLKVAGRTSSFAFKGRNEDLRIIGEALGVTKVLEGSVRRSGERLRVTAQLINVADGFHMWTETYDRQMADIFDIQDDVAGAITDALQLHLKPDADRPTKNVQAYALYLEALTLRAPTNHEEIVLAQDLLDRAIALDSRFARAYELKASFYWMQAGWDLDAAAGQKLAYESATKALKLDPTLAGARYYAGTASPDWSWTLEIMSLEELLRAQGDDISALSAMCYDTVFAGYFDESARLAQRIIDLEPLAARGYWRKGEALLGAGRRNEAHTMLERAADLGDITSMWFLGADFATHGDYETAIHWWMRQAAVQGRDPAEVRPFVENARQPSTGKVFLEQWVEAEVAEASNIAELRAPYFWYLAFGYLDEFWDGIDVLSGGVADGWTNSDTLEHDGMVLRHSGFARHPKYLARANAITMTELWDERGPPEHCKKVDGNWVCE